MSTDTNGVYTNGKWEFDESVADCFEDMLERSIPQYNVMRDSVVSLAHSIVAERETVSMLDIGCSDGIMIEHLLKKFNDVNAKFVGIDVSEPMLLRAKHRLLDGVIDGTVSIQNCDLREQFPVGLYDVVTSVLSIQFTPIEHRQKIIQNIYDNLSHHGCFLMVEKVLGNTHSINKLMVDTYYSLKRSNGYTQEQIDRKRLSLEGVLVPVTNDWNIDLLRQAGFKQVDVFWRWMNFVGYIAIK